MVTRIQELTERVAESLEENLNARGEKVKVVPMEILKINDQSLHGVTIQKKEDEGAPAPTLYIEQAFAEGLFEERTIVAKLEADYLSYKSDDTIPRPEITIPDLSMEGIREHLGLRLVGKDYNQRFLETVPSMDVGNGYALIADISLPASDEGVFGTVVTNEMSAANHYDTEQLFAVAMENSVKIPVTLDNMSNVLGIESEDEPMLWVLQSANGSRFGAAALFYPGTQGVIAEKLGEDYICLPSSQMEFLIMRWSVYQSLKHNLRSFVKEVNRFVVRPEEVLSDNVLKYSRKTGQLTLLEEDQQSASEGGEAYAS